MRRHARVRQAPLGREAGDQARIGAGSGGAQVRGRWPQHGVVRGHHLREDPPGLAIFGARDGHMIVAHRGMVDGLKHYGRARRRGIEDGAGQAKPARRLRPSQRLRLTIRVAASVQNHAGERHPAVDGVDLVAVGQRGHGVTHEHREVGMRARAHLRHARGGRAGSVRVHRGNLQQGEDTFFADLPQPRRIQRGQLAQGKQPFEGA